LSNIRAGTISGVNGTDPVTLTKQNAAKAYVRMVGSGTVSITESLNHSSVVDTAVGQYTLNLSSSMSTSTYAVQSHDNNYGTGRLTVCQDYLTIVEDVLSQIHILIHQNSGV